MAKKMTAKKAKGKMMSETVKQSALAEAIRAYRTDTTINANIADGCITEVQLRHIAQLDLAMVTLPDMTLSRITIGSVLRKIMEREGVSNVEELVGKNIEVVPYMSTTKRELNELLQQRYDCGLGKPVCMVIHTEGKAKGIDVVHFMESATIDDGFSRQQEVILARGQKFLVKKIVMGDGWGEAYPIIHFYAV